MTQLRVQVFGEDGSIVHLYNDEAKVGHDLFAEEDALFDNNNEIGSGYDDQE